MKRKAIAIMAIEWTIVGACTLTPGPSSVDPGSEMEVLPVDAEHDYSGIAWNQDDLVVSRSKASIVSDGFRLIQLDASSGSASVERVPSNLADCKRLDEVAPFNAKGDLVWISTCWTDEPGLRRVEILSAAELLGETTVRSSVLTRYSGGGLDVRGDTILTSYGSAICETLGELAGRHIEPVSISVTGPGGTFDTGFVVGEVDCSKTGIAVLPATNAEGRMAFLASTRAIGIEGRARLETPFDIYVAPQDSKVAEPLGFQVFAPSVLTWTPDGSYLIVSGRDESGHGSWRVDPRSGEATQVLPFRLQSASWADDGSKIAAIRPVESANGGSGEIVIIATGALLPPT